MGNIILHAFNWTFEEIKSQSDEISNLGYSAVLISPPAFSEGDEWYYRYQPLDYRFIKSPLGTLFDFTEMIKELKNRGLKVYIDIVFNHMAYRENNDLNFPGESYLEKYKQDKQFSDNYFFGDVSKNLFSENDFNINQCIDPEDYDDPDKISDVHNHRISDMRAEKGLPDLNYQSENVISFQREYLCKLKELGVDGFRIDAAKHMPMEHIKNVFTKTITQNLFVFGEIIPASHGKFIDSFLTQVDFSAYDFDLFYSVRDALSHEGSLEKLVNPKQLDSFKSLTFAITHDIPNNEAMRTFILGIDDPNRTDELLAYAYILGRDGGVPLVYSDKGEDDGVYTNLWKEMYKNENLKFLIKFHNTMFGKKMHIIAAGQCYLIFHREGEGIVTINKSTTSLTIDVDALNIQGSFVNIQNNESIENIGDITTFTMPERSYQLFLKKQ